MLWLFKSYFWFTSGRIPADNPFVTNSDWSEEVYQIGVRNPQGMDLDPLTNDVFISNHGPKGGARAIAGNKASPSLDIALPSSADNGMYPFK